MRICIPLSTAVALVATMVTACTAQVTSEPAYAPGPPPPPVVVSEAPPPGDEDVVVDVEPPVVNIEAYPSAVYGGVTVYYVGGVWYRRAPHGWARYQVEPPGLARARVAHAREARWAREGAPRPAPRPAPRSATEMQRPSRAPHREVRP